MCPNNNIVIQQEPPAHAHVTEETPPDAVVVTPTPPTATVTKAEKTATAKAAVSKVEVRSREGARGETGDSGAQGAPGPPGPAGPPGTVTGNNYTHVQNIVTDVWDITHNLGYTPALTAFDSGGTQVEGEIEHIDDNNLRLHFTSAFAGHAYLS